MAQAVLNQPVRSWDSAEFGLACLGALPLKRTVEIASSRIGVGFEALDRRMFDPSCVYPHLADLGAKWARVQTGWSRCEIAPGKYDFAWLDEIVDRLIDIGVTPWFNLGYGNQLYMPDAPHRAAVGCVPILYGEQTLAAWKRFVKAIAEHFAGRVKQWEIWNEPNCGGFWRPGKPDPGQYVELVRQTAPIIRQAIPQAFIIGGATLKAEPALLDEYLRCGLGELVDAYSYHPYRLVPEWGYAQEVAAMRQVLAAREAKLELWQGECGCPAQAHDHHDQWLGVHTMDEAIHARFVIRRVVTDLALGLDRVHYFHATDLMHSEYVLSDGEQRRPVMMGLVRGRDYQPRQAFDGMRAICTLLDGDAIANPSPVSVHPTSDCAGPSPKIDYIAAQAACFDRAGYPLIAYWRPGDAQLRSPVMCATLSFSNCGLRDFAQPVLVDPLTRELFDLAGRIKCVAYRRYEIDNVPYADYPLFIADRQAL